MTLRPGERVVDGEVRYSAAWLRTPPLRLVEPAAAEETIGERLRRLRLERGLSQRALGGPGVSYAYVSRIEAGKRTPSMKALRLLAARLGVAAEYLETGVEPPDLERALRALAVARARAPRSTARVVQRNLDRAFVALASAVFAPGTGRTW